MKSYKGLPIFVWILLGLLAISAAMLSLGQRDSTANPSADSYSPSGTAAFAKLLQRQGYEVRVDRWPRPRLAPNEVALAFPLSTAYGFGRDSQTDFRKYLDDQVRKGRRAIVFKVPTEFADASRALLKNGPQPVTVRGETKSIQIFAAPVNSRKVGNLKASPVPPSVSVEPNPSSPSSSDSDDDDDSPNSTASLADVRVGLWDFGSAVHGQVEPADDANRFLTASQLGSGRMLEVADGAFATNRFLDRADDAKAALAIVALFARPGDHLVFTEAAFGNVEAPGVLELIGPWANAGWQQLLFLGLVVIYTLGKRFGIPDETRPAQRGARELLDALGDTYFRGRQTAAAMRSALDRSNNELRTALRLPRDAPKDARDRLLPPSLVAAMSTLEQAALSDDRIPSAEALELVAKARRETLQFLGHRRTLN